MKEAIAAAPAEASPRRHQRRIELISVILLSVAGVATSWSSYQAARWGGMQSTEYSRAGALRVESTRASSAADQRRAIDISLFMAWIEATAGGDERVADFYRERFRDDFVPSFEAWLATAAEPGVLPATSPFVLAEYALPDVALAETLEAEAEAVFVSGQAANQRSDAYVLNAVLLASVLFFSGIVQQFRIPPLQYALLTVAVLMLSVGLTRIAILPKLF